MEKPDLQQFPITPGVYLYKDANGHILYVGKARRLRQRIASYFRDDKELSSKTRIMLSHAQSLDILSTGTEKEALLLEAGLIKKHRPRYNIVLRDDKEYLLFRIGTEHPFPRVEVIRHNRKRSGELRRGKTFGPFSSGTAARETWKLIHKYFPLRRCRDVAFKNRTRPCLYHDMGQCLGPCVLPVKKEEYQAVLAKVGMLLEGRSHELMDALRDEMQQAAEQLAYEKAAMLRDQLRAIERTLERQSVVLHRTSDLDLVGVAQMPEGLALGIVFVREGMLVDGRNFFWPGLTLEDMPELLLSFLAQFYIQGRAFIPPRIVVPWLVTAPGGNVALEPTLGEGGTDAGAHVSESMAEYSSALTTLEAALAELRGAPVRITSPQGIDEDRLVLMAMSNAREAVKTTTTPAMAEVLARHLLSKIPVRRIEIVDISHTGGQQTRAGMVVFEDEEPVLNAYRSYALDDDLLASAAQAGDDYAALAAWAVRRVASGPPFADLVLIDGGKGQLAAVERAFAEAGIAGKFALAAITKARDEDGKADRRAGNISDRIFVPGRSNPLNIHAGSPELLFLQRMRDTAHDFVLGRHRKARSAAAITGELTRLPGVGPALARALFEHFGSLAALAKADEEMLRQVPGVGAAKAVALKARLSALVIPAVK